MNQTGKDSERRFSLSLPRIALSTLISHFSAQRSPAIGLSETVQPQRISGLTLWLRMMRIPFLQATIIPVVLGGVVAWQLTGNFQWGLFLLTLLGASLIHIATNMLNDYFDYKSGNDLMVKHQNPFAGGGRVLTAGLVTPSKHLAVSLSCLVLGCLTGIYLILANGLTMLLWLGLVGTISSYFYVGPPLKLAYRGIGEIIVGLNFGPIMTLGSYYVQTGSWTRLTEPFLASLPIGLLIAAVLWINEFPDMDADRSVGKKTMVLRLGYLRSIGVFISLLVGSYTLVVLYSLLRVFGSLQVTSYATLIVLASLPLGVKAVKVLRSSYQDPHAIIPANAGTVMLHLSFGILAILGFVIGAIFNF